MGQQLIEAEEYIRRVRLCLFEVGFRDVDIKHMGWLPNGLPAIATYDQHVPTPLAYMAARLAIIKDIEGVPQCCYGCFKIGYDTQSPEPARLCRLGQCPTGGPEWPSHEELLGADMTEGLEIHADFA